MRPLNFGVFITPFHPTGQSPTVALEYDLERTVALDRLGYDEVWFGEHHSGGYELIACPEVFIAAAAERTKHIRLGTGVVSLPYHHPLMVADRWVLLDHLTRGRVMFGAGPGALPRAPAGPHRRAQRVARRSRLPACRLPRQEVAAYRQVERPGPGSRQRCCGRRPSCDAGDRVTAGWPPGCHCGRPDGRGRPTPVCGASCRSCHAAG